MECLSFELRSQHLIRVKSVYTIETDHKASLVPLEKGVQPHYWVALSIEDYPLQRNCPVHKQGEERLAQGSQKGLEGEISTRSFCLKGPILSFAMGSPVLLCTALCRVKHFYQLNFLQYSVIWKIIALNCSRYWFFFLKWALKEEKERMQHRRYRYQTLNSLLHKEMHSYIEQCHWVYLSSYQLSKNVIIKRAINYIA